MAMPHVPRATTPFRVCLLFHATAIGCLAQDLDCNRIGVSQTAYRRLLNTQFTRIISPQSANSIGNFGAYSSDKGQITFAGSTVIRQRSVLAVKVNGSGTNGFLPLISNGDPIKAFGADLQLHLMESGSSRVSYTAPSCAAFKRDSAQAADRYKREAARIRVGGDSIAAALRLDSIRRVMVRQTAQVESLLVLLGSAIGEHSRSPTPESLAALIQRRRALDSAKVTLVVSRVDSIVAARDSAPNAVFALSRLGDERAVALQKAYALLNTADFSIGWFSLGYGAQGTSFMLIDTSATLVAQLKSTTNIAHTVRLQYSRYSTPAQGGAASYWTVGASTATTDNFVKLKKLDVTDIRQIGPTSGTREARSSVTAYQGAYEQGLASASVFADYYRFLTPQNTTALHLYPSVDVQRATVGVANFGLGLLSIFAKSSDAAARFNAELFITFTDLANAREVQLKIYERSQIGVRFSLPFSFLPVE
jgi:hypothetical protein